MSWSSPGGKQFVLGSLLVVAFGVLAVTLAVRGRRPPMAVDLRAVDALLATGCAVVALAAGFVSGLRWRLVGDASSLRVAVTFLTLSSLYVVVELAPFVHHTLETSPTLAYLDAALALTFTGLLAVSILAPPIQTRISAPRLAGSVLAAVAFVVALQVAIGSLEPFAYSPRGGGAVERAAAMLALAATYVGLGALSIARGFRRSSWLWTWLGLSTVALGLATALRIGTGPSAGMWSTGALVLELLGMLLAVNGLGQELKGAYLLQRSRLFDATVEVEATAARHRAEIAAREERDHEARSALLAIQSATRGLEASYDDLSREAQTSLRTALAGEIELLRELVASGHTRSRSAPFDVADAIAPVVVCQQAAGLDVTFAPGEPLIAVASPSELAEIVQTLLDNVRDHAPASPVLISTQESGSRAIVRVEDQGPGVPAARRERIFGRGESSTGAHDRGLGLFVARKMARARGGDVWVEPGQRSGAAFVVAFPGPSLAVRGLPRAELQHVGDDFVEARASSPDLDAAAGYA